MKRLTHPDSLPSLLASRLKSLRCSPHPRYPVTVIPCPTVLPPTDLESKTSTCGILTMPKTDDAPEGCQIDRTYAVRHNRRPDHGSAQRARGSILERGAHPKIRILSPSPRRHSTGHTISQHLRRSPLGLSTR